MGGQQTTQVIQETAYHVQFPCKERRSAVLRFAFIRRMILKKLALVLKCSSDRLRLINVTLATVDHRYITKAKGNNPPSQNVDDICSLIPGKCNQLSFYQVLAATHIKSTFVRTPIVLVPSGSTSRANFKPSEFARSVLAAVTAKMIHAGFEINFRSMSLICFSMSLGWSPTGTRVTPGKSTSVKVRTFGEYIRRLIGIGEIPAFLPVFASVSRIISARILLKS